MSARYIRQAASVGGYPRIFWDTSKQIRRRQTAGGNKQTGSQQNGRKRKGRQTD